MSETSAAPAAPPAEETSAPVAVAPAADKNEIYSRIAASLNSKVDTAFGKVAERIKTKHNEEIHLRRVFGDDDGRQIVVGVFTELVGVLLTEDPEGGISAEKRSLGLPGGLGSLELLTAGATTKKTPQGTVLAVPKRWRVKWNTGKVIQERLAALPAPPADVPAVAPAAETAAAPA